MEKKRREDRDKSTIHKDVSRAHKWGASLDKRMHTICEQLHTSPDALRDQLDDRTKWNAGQWKFIQKERQLLKKSLNKKLGTQAQERLEKKRKKSDTERKKRAFLGDRKKWIRM